ncbi:hypothetical protein NDU88_005210 [Pleurodeles waltl]|uniref:Uncharacterized protein n=1 Tax=Pleurodeles waltl TaxID=8319 RepID=A0AAV7L0K3_PLEWA|nr:hypothetical protein NDU88_005210 [Pleurodeles waltl]
MHVNGESLGPYEEFGPGSSLVVLLGFEALINGVSDDEKIFADGTGKSMDGVIVVATVDETMVTVVEVVVDESVVNGEVVIDSGLECFPVLVIDGFEEEV